MRFLACAVLLHLYAKYWFDTFGINLVSLYWLELLNRHCSNQDTIVKDIWCITVSLKDDVLDVEYAYMLFLISEKSYQWRADDAWMMHRQKDELNQHQHNGMDE